MRMSTQQGPSNENEYPQHVSWRKRIKALIAMAGQLSLRVGWKIGPER